MALPPHPKFSLYRHALYRGRADSFGSLLYIDAHRFVAIEVTSREIALERDYARAAQ